jgi:cation-transporting ATPase 13A1
LIAPVSKETSHKYRIYIKRRYQFLSALKRMSTLSSVEDSQGRKWVAAVKGAPETLKGMYKTVPSWYDETYRYYTRRGSRVLALGVKNMTVESSKVRHASYACKLELMAGQRHSSCRCRVRPRICRFPRLPLPLEI